MRKDFHKQSKSETIVGENDIEMEAKTDVETEEKTDEESNGKTDNKEEDATNGQMYEGFASDFWDAVNHSSVKGMEYFYNEGLHKHCFNASGETPLHIACRRGNIEIVSFLISKGVCVNTIASNASKNTPLIEAAHKGFYSIVKLLIDNKANLDYQNAYGDTAIHSAVYEDYFCVIQLLMEYGANDKLKNKNGNIPDQIWIHLPN